MRTKWTVLLWMLMISGLLAAQNTANTSFQVKGILLDSLTQEGEPYATIKIVKKEAPAKALKMLVTDMKGQFQEKVPGTGNFVMTITSVGVYQRFILASCAPWRVASLASNRVSVPQAVLSLYCLANL